MRIRDDWRGAFKGAFRKGWEAERCGKPIEDCPYEPKPGPYAAAARFRDAWRDGWRKARKERESDK